MTHLALAHVDHFFRGLAWRVAAVLAVYVIGFIVESDGRIDDAPNRIRMVGSLRAGKDCMECHSIRRGELLGAFSYELVPPRPMPVKQREETRTEPGA